MTSVTVKGGLKQYKAYYVFRREIARKTYEHRRMRLKIPASCFGRRLREARLRADIPQDKLGVAIGLDEGTASARISRYETGTHAPPYDVAQEIAKVVRVPVAYFYCSDDNLAKLILVWGTASAGQQQRIQAYAEKVICEAGDNSVQSAAGT